VAGGREPLAHQRLDAHRIEVIEYLLQARWIGTGADAVVQRFKSDTGLGQLAFGRLMAVETDARGGGEVGGELDEQRAEVLINDVEVVLVTHHGGTVQPRKGCARVRADLLSDAKASKLLGMAGQQETGPHPAIPGRKPLS
jgi:hypothetical protein